MIYIQYATNAIIVNRLMLNYILLASSIDGLQQMQRSPIISLLHNLVISIWSIVHP